MSDIGIMSDIKPAKIKENRDNLPRFFRLKRFEFVCKPSSVVYGHLSRLAVADKLKRYSRHLSDGQPYMINTQSCSGWGLHGIPHYCGIGELLPRLSILTANGRSTKSTLKANAKPFAAVYFCCTIPKVTLAWRYQAPCPMLLGLSSWRLRAPRPYNGLKPC